MTTHRSWRCILAILIAFVCAASSRADILPGQIVGDDVVAVLVLDTAKLDPAVLQKHANEMLGEDAKQLEQPLRQLGAMRQAFAAVGGMGFGFVFRGPDENGRLPEPDVFVKYSEGKDVDALKATLAGIVGNRAVITSVDATTLLVSPREAPALGKAGKQHAAFEKLLAAQDGAAIALALISNDALKNMLPMPKDDEPAVDDRDRVAVETLRLTQHVFAARSLAGAVHVGSQFKVVANAVTADAAAAAALARQFQTAAAAMKKFSESKDAGRGRAEVLLFSAVFTGVKLQPQDATVSATLEGDGAKQAAAAVIKAIVASRNTAREMLAANNMRQLSIAIISYADQNDGKLPNSLDDVAELVGGKEELARLIAHPITGEKVGVEYTKPAAKWNDVKSSSTTVMLREVRGGKVYAAGWAGYMDGHLERGDVAKKKDQEPGKKQRDPGQDGNQIEPEKGKSGSGKTNDGKPVATKKAEAQLARNMQALISLIHIYANGHKDNPPNSLDELAQYLDSKEELAKLLKHTVSGDKVAFRYVKPAFKLDDAKTWEKTPVFIEQRGGKDHPGGFIAYLDQHVEGDVDWSLLESDRRPSESDAPKPKPALTEEKLLVSNMHQLLIAIHSFSVDHNGALPDSFDDMWPYFADKSLLKHPITGETVGLKYVKPAKNRRDIKEPSKTAVLFELRDGKVVEDGWVGYMDGHVERGDTVKKKDQAPPKKQAEPTTREKE